VRCQWRGHQSHLRGGRHRPRPHVLYDYQFLAMEHWDNAVLGAQVAAHNMVCDETDRWPHLLIPQFWSGQFGVNIKSVGVPSFGDEIMFTQGSVKQRRFAAAYGRRGRIVGAVTFNHGKWIPYYEAQIARSAPFPPNPAGSDFPEDMRVMPADLTAKSPERHRDSAKGSAMTPEEAWNEAMKLENRADPYPFFDELRKTPVARVTNDVYAVTGYAELIALAHDPRVSSDMRRSPLGARPREIIDPSVAEMIERYGQDLSFIQQDPPDHDRARRSCMRYFGPPHSPDVIPSQEPLCQQIVNDLLDKAMGKTRIDVVDEFAYPLPVDVICHILGVPLEDEPQFHAWIADAMAGIFDLGPEIETEEGQARRAKGVEAGQELKKYIIGLVERAAKSPCPGMISQLVHDDGPDGPMSPSEIVNNTILLFVAGHDSTVNLISHCVLTVLRNPGSIELLCSRPDLIPGAIEEVLRLQSSVQFFPSRSALADIEIAGTTI